MSKHKGSGPDNIPTMLWKGHNFDTGLLYFCNETLEGSKPSALKSTLKTIYDYHTEKVNLSQPSNYRGIRLTLIASKFYNSLLTKLHIQALGTQTQKESTWIS